MTQPVCVVVGVGPGNGSALAQAFSDEGMAVALLARSKDTTEKLAASLPYARAYQCDVTDEESVKTTFAAISNDLGAPSVVIYNAGNALWGDFETINASQFEQAWRVNALGSFLVGQQGMSLMKESGRGSIFFISATAAKRGTKNMAAFAPAKAAQRILAESMAKSLWPLGIHVGVIIIDAVVDLPTTRKKMPGKEDAFFLKPKDMAVSVVAMSKQPKSAWTFEMEMRPSIEVW